MTHQVNIVIADIKAEPKFESERVTQAFLNESLEILEQGAEYTKIKLEDGYTGYIKNEFISKTAQPEGDDYMVSASIAVAFTGADQNASAATMVPFTSKVKIIENTGVFAKSVSNRFGEIYFSADDLIPMAQLPQFTQHTIPLFIESARRFIGSPYLWGGKSFFGFDCSGFIQANFKFFNVDLPRDTSRQIERGNKIEFDDIGPGDLVFFERHVGLVIDNGQFLHASSSMGGVYVSKFEDKIGINDYTWNDKFQAARRLIKQ